MENPKAKAFLSVELMENDEISCSLGGGSLLEKMHMVTTLVSALLKADVPQVLLDVAVRVAFENREQFDKNIKQHLVMPMPDSIGSTNKEES